MEETEAILDSMYNAEQINFAKEKVSDIENAHVNHKVSVAWNGQCKHQMEVIK